MYQYNSYFGVSELKILNRSGWVVVVFQICGQMQSEHLNDGFWGTGTDVGVFPDSETVETMDRKIPITVNIMTEINCPAPLFLLTMRSITQSLLVASR